MPVYDYKGQIFEMDETDPAAARAKIQAALGETPQTETPLPQEFGAQQVAQMALPAIGAVAPGPTGMADLAKGTYENIIKPTASTAVDIVKNYPKRPLEMVADVALTATGFGPVAGMIRGGGGAVDVARQAYQGAKTLATELTQLPAYTAEKLGPAVNVVTQKLTGPEYDAFKKLADTVGIEKAIHDFKFSPQLMNDPAFSTAIGEMRATVPSKPASVMSKLAGPFLRTGAKVLGPVGMGMDIYEAGKFAQESQLGPRLAQGQGRLAQQAFRNMATNQTYGGLTAEQQQMLEQDKIDQAIRRKAASKVLGPIDPGQ